MYLVCYDITSDWVRNKIVKILEGYGRRVQYSVFECDLNEKRYQELYGKLLMLMQGVEVQDGNICFYYICKNCIGKKQVIGVPKKPAGYPDEVLKNKPAPGVDGVTYDMFETNKKEYLKQLHLELQEHRYYPLPVKLVKLYKGEKERTVASYSMRDKVVQQSIALELQKIYEPLFSKVTYAYRNGRSALQAINHMESKMCGYKEGWVLKMDIHAFFDTISVKKLQRELQSTLKEEDVVDLILENAQAESLQEDGEIVKKPRGIWQGSGIAPILSNIYLKDFDYQMEERADVFVRYSDDMLAVAKDQKAASELLRFARVSMHERDLSLNEKKTMLVPISSGVDFLGYHLDQNGKSVPVKAEQNLQERLESMFLTSPAISVEEKEQRSWKAGSSIIGKNEGFRASLNMQWCCIW